MIMLHISYTLHTFRAVHCSSGTSHYIFRDIVLCRMCICAKYPTHTWENSKYSKKRNITYGMDDRHPEYDVWIGKCKFDRWQHVPIVVDLYSYWSINSKVKKRARWEGEWGQIDGKKPMFFGVKHTKNNIQQPTQLIKNNSLSGNTHTHTQSSYKSPIFLSSFNKSSICGSTNRVVDFVLLRYTHIMFSMSQRLPLHSLCSFSQFEAHGSTRIHRMFSE